MSYVVNHVHIKSNDPKKTADWFVNAFNVEIRSDTVRSFGDRFIRCYDANGFNINISGPRTNETLGPGDANPHLGLEHFGFDSEDIEADIKKLTGMGAELKEGPIDNPGGPLIAFLACPGDIRVELIQQR